MKLLDKLKKFFNPPYIERADYKDGILTVKYSDKSVSQYKGSCTVWHELPYMTRCNTPKERLLCDIWQYIRHYGNPYPLTHR